VGAGSSTAESEHPDSAASKELPGALRKVPWVRVYQLAGGALPNASSAITLMVCEDQVEKWTMTPVQAFILKMPFGLAVIYVLAVVIWYELLRLAILSQVARRRANRARIPLSQWDSWEQAELAEREREVAEQEAAEASEPDPARRLYYLARKAAKAERDLATQMANEAAERAVAGIEHRYREIDAELDQEEAERLKTRQG
jgi:hypothetical protein